MSYLYIIAVVAPNAMHNVLVAQKSRFATQNVLALV